MDEKELRKGNIGIVLNSYNDMFSGFDPRGYSEKALSDDFLIECKKAAREKGMDVELILFLAKEKRNFNNELMIKKRLKNHFQRHFIDIEKGINAIRKEGIIWFLVGACVMFSSTFLYDLEQFFYRFLFIVAEPAGWFLFWEGLYKIFIEAKEKKPHYIFYKKMTRAKITFKDS